MYFLLPSGEHASRKLEKQTWMIYPCFVRNFPATASVLGDVLIEGGGGGGEEGGEEEEAEDED